MRRTTLAVAAALAVVAAVAAAPGAGKTTHRKVVQTVGFDVGPAGYAVLP